MIKLSNLTPHPDNPRKITDAQMDKLKDSIRRDPEYMQPRPLVVNKDNIILAGNQRWKALKALGHDEIPEDWVRVVDWDEEKSRRFVIMDNHQSGDWDVDLLREHWMDVDLEGLGVPFDVDLETENEGLTDEDDVPEEPAEPVSKIGDIWLLGEHRVMCGDSTSKADVERLMDGKKADLCLTDPPYGIKRDKGFGGSIGFGGSGKPITRRKYKDEWDTERPNKDFFDMLLAMGGNIIIFGGQYFADLLPQGKHWIVWDKKNTMPTFGDCELAWTNIKRDSVKIKEFEYNGLIGKEKERLHPTQKPVGLFVDLLNEYAKGGQIVCDPFLGSGTTIIACEKTNRICYGMEISPAYVDVAITRWQNFTGRQAVHAETGKTFGG